MSPSNPHDAYWMLLEAIKSNDPVIFFEPKSRYWPKGPVDFERNDIDLHATRVMRPGTDATLVGHGAMVATLLAAADIAAGEGKSLEVVDLRSISPIDYAPILESVEKPAGLWWLRRPMVLCRWAVKSPQPSPSGRSTRCSRRRFASQPSMRRIHRRHSSLSSCPAPTGCWKPLTGPWRSRRMSR